MTAPLASILQRKTLTGLALGLLCFLLPTPNLHAQIPDDGNVPAQEALTEPDNLPINLTDTTTGDSAKVKNVRQRTVSVDLELLLNNRNPRDAVSYWLPTLMEPDPLWRQQGFYAWLGQIGKPYRRYLYGLEGSYFREPGVYINPYTGAEDVYTIDPEHGNLYFDTRTPFVNVYYGQGKADLAQLRVDIAQNINPFVNVGLWYYRRNAAGVYNNFSTSHDNIGLTANGHTPNERYNVFLSSNLHQGNDDLNGGVSQVFSYEELFNKASQPVVLSEATLRRMHKSVALKHSFRLTGDTVMPIDTTWTLQDSVWSAADSSWKIDSLMEVATKRQPHRLQVYNGFLVDYFHNQFTDTLIDPAINAVQFPVYPTLGDSAFFYERFRQTRYRVDGGLSYRFKLAKLETGHRVEIAAERIDFNKNLRTRTQNKLTTSWWGDLRVSPGPFEVLADARVQTMVNNLFSVENYVEIGGSLGLPNEVFDYARKVPGPIRTELDSILVSKTHRPITFDVRSIVYARNPTLQQAYGVGWPGNTIESDTALSNTIMQHLRGGITYRAKSRWTKFGEVPGTELGLSAFVSRLNQMIYYDTTMQLVQAPRSTYLQWMGLEARIRLRLGKFYLEDRTIYQISSSNDSLVDRMFGNMQPSLYGKASFYFEQKDLKFAGILRIGLDYYYHLNYNAPLFDAASQQFYPQTQFVQAGYHRFDVFFGTQVKKAYVFLKLAHANEGIGTPGYFTTLFYPMFDRTFMVGLNWTFFD